MTWYEAKYIEFMTQSQKCKDNKDKHGCHYCYHEAQNYKRMAENPVTGGEPIKEIELE